MFYVITFDTIIPLIEEGWNKKTDISVSYQGPIREAVSKVLLALDRGEIRVAEQQEGSWQVHQWIKKAILLSFRLNDNRLISGGASESYWYDKVPLKFSGWQKEDFQKAGFRAVPGSIVRHGAFISPGVILLPSFVNIGAYIGDNSMIDAWATVGSCAQIGKNVHLSGGAGIGGVLEPLQADPVIIEDDCFIGARSEIVEGVRIGTGSVISMGVFIGASTKIIDRHTGEIFMGHVPPYSVVVTGTLPGKNLPDGSPGPSTACAVIVKRVDEKTRSKVSINDLLRD